MYIILYKKYSKKNIAYFIISESIKFLVKKYLREVIQMCSETLLSEEENESPIKSMFFD